MLMAILGFGRIWTTRVNSRSHRASANPGTNSSAAGPSSQAHLQGDRRSSGRIWPDMQGCMGYH
jgi:hypothetical protein